MRKSILVASCLAVCVVALFGVEEQRLNVKPGVWQVRLNVKYSGLPPQNQTYKMCLKEKDLNKGWTQGDNNCRWNVVKSTSSDLELRSTACRARDSEVDLNFHAVDSEHVQATLHGTSNEQGTKVNFDGDYTGTWLGADCPADLK